MIYHFQGKTPQCHSSAYIAPGARIIGNVILEESTSVWFNSVLRGDNEQIYIGKGSNIQDNSVIHVDPGIPVYVGENVTVGHNAILHGCKIEDGSLIGMGATILNGAVIGQGSLVAAGAVVTQGTIIEPHTLVAGVPAKPIRKLNPEQQEMLKRGALSYIQKGLLYKQENIVE